MQQRDRPVTARPQPEWLDGLSHRDFLLDGGPCPEAMWHRLDWSQAWCDLGPSPVGNLGPYWHVPVISPSPDEGTVHRLYPKILQGKWAALIRQAATDVRNRPPPWERAEMLRRAEAVPNTLEVGSVSYTRGRE